MTTQPSSNTDVRPSDRPVARAVVVGTGDGAAFEQGRASPLTPLVDRPFLQHVVECIVDRGIRKIDFLLHDRANEIEAVFQDGRRWGADFRFHLVRDGFCGGNDEGIWIQRNVCLHPTIHVEPPIFIGSNCEIEREVTLGPNAVILDGCFVNAGCGISNSMILTDSLVGEGLALDQCVLDRHRLFHVEYDTALTIDDDLLIGNANFSVPISWGIGGWLSRAIALATLILFSPALILVAAWQRWTHGLAFETEEVIRLPAKVSDDEQQTFFRIRVAGAGESKSILAHFLFELLPGLIHVVRGELGWVGVTPLTKHELRRLPKDWIESYLACEAGLINESMVMYGPQAGRDETLIAEVYHAVTAKSFWSRLGQIGAYAQGVVRGPRASRVR